MSNLEEKVTHIYRPDEGVVVVTFTDKYDFVADEAVSTQVAVNLLNSLDKPVFWIVDFSQTLFGTGNSLTVDDLTVAANKAAGLGQHPFIRKVFWVTNSRVLELVAQGMGEEVFGRVNIQLVASLDEALAYTRV